MLANLFNKLGLKKLGGFFGKGSEKAGRPDKQTYIVYVDDNYHPMDEEERYQAGVFDDCASAQKFCRDMVDSFLTTGYQPGMAWQELLSAYKGYGQDPWIATSDAGCQFSAWTYAEQRCQDICQPPKEHLLTAETLKELDGLYESRSSTGRPDAWGRLVEELRAIRRLVEAGVPVKIEGTPTVLTTWTQFYSWAHGRYHMLEDGYDSWIGDDNS